MNDPKRWSEGGEASELERELVLAGQAPKLPDSERRALWASIALGLPAAAPPAPTTAPAPLVSGGGLGASATKILIFLATVAGLGAGVNHLWPLWPRESAAPKAASVVVAAHAPLTPTATPAAEPTAIVGPVTTSAASTTPLEPKRATTASQLREESLAVLEARAALRAGDAGRSLGLLQQAHVRFPRGALGQEREALTIEALARTGQTASARRRAEAFLRDHPQSPYVADLRRIATP
jgi:hypothetical protein